MQSAHVDKEVARADEVFFLASDMAQRNPVKTGVIPTVKLMPVTVQLNSVKADCTQKATERNSRVKTQKVESIMEETEDMNQHYLANWAQDCAIKEEKCPRDAVKNDPSDMQIADKEPPGADEVYLLASDTAKLNRCIH